jgi:methionyl-tRNA formyltransferase
MKVLFMGTPDLAATILERIIQTGYEVIGVVTQPDKQKGRGQSVSFSPVKELAIKYELPVYQPLKAKDPEFIKTVEELAPEVVIVAAFGQILSKALLDIPPFGCINVHASLLPKYRGAAPIQYSIIDGEEETGITIMYMDVGIDTGDMILQAKTPIAEDETGGSLYDKLAVLGADLLIEALDKIKLGTSIREPQDHSKATHVKIISKEMGNIDFKQPAIKIERLIRGLNPWPSAYTFINGKTLKLWQAEALKIDDNNVTNNSVQPGEVIAVQKDAILVKTGDGILAIKELQLEGKKRMTADAFLRGYSVPVGSIFGV